MTSDCKTLRVSRSGTLTAATVVIGGEEVFTAVSVYSPWERPLAANAPIWADASAHRLLSDLTPLISDRADPLSSRGLEHPAGVWRARGHPISGQVPDRLRPGGGSRPPAHRARAPIRTPGRPLAGRTATRQQVRAHLLSQPANARDGDAAARLRLRVAIVRSPCPRDGPQRPQR